MYKISIYNIFIYYSSTYKIFRLLYIYTYVYIDSNTDKRYSYLYFTQYLYLFSSNIYEYHISTRYLNRPIFMHMIVLYVRVKQIPVKVI